MTIWMPTPRLARMTTSTIFPNYLQNQKGRGSGRPSASTRKKKNDDTVTLGYVQSPTERVDVWAGINKQDKVYRRCAPLGQDGKSGKTSVAHSQIEYLPRFKNLDMNTVDVLVRAEIENRSSGKA
jgi:hypothetical protein